MRLLLQKVILILASVGRCRPWPGRMVTFTVGPFYADFPLTLSMGSRIEAAGPLYYSQESESQQQWALPPFYCHTRTAMSTGPRWEILYPLLSYRRFGAEYQLQLLELISFSGGRASPENGAQAIHDISALFPAARAGHEPELYGGGAVLRPSEEPPLSRRNQICPVSALLGNAQKGHGDGQLSLPHF